MTSNAMWRRYLEAGAAVGQLTAARAEEIARGLVAPDEEERRRARRDVDRMARFGLVVGEQLVDLARLELARQLKGRSTESVERLFTRLAEMVGGEPLEDQSDDQTPATEPAHAPLSQVPPSGNPGVGDAPVRPSEKQAQSSGPAPAEAPARPKQHKKHEKERGKNSKKKEKKHNTLKKQKKEKEPARSSEGGDSRRVLTLAKPPGSAPTS